MHRFLRIAVVFVSLGLGCESQPPIAGGKSTEHWIEASQNENAPVRVEAIKKLGNIGGKDSAAIATVVDALSDPSPAVRKEAIYAVVRNRQSTDEALPALEEMKDNDQDVEVRRIANEAYGNLTGGK